MECSISVQHVQQLQQAGEYERDKYTTWCKHSENAEISQSLIKLLFHQLTIPVSILLSKVASKC